jgi:hypothetical protein
VVYDAWLSKGGGERRVELRWHKPLVVDDVFTYDREIYRTFRHRGGRARRALEDCLQDEPQWRGLLDVNEVEFDHEHTSLN